MLGCCIPAELGRTPRGEVLFRALPERPEMLRLYSKLVLLFSQTGFWARFDRPRCAPASLLIIIVFIRISFCLHGGRKLIAWWNIYMHDQPSNASLLNESNAFQNRKTLPMNNINFIQWETLKNNGVIPVLTRPPFVVMVLTGTWRRTCDSL